MYRINLGEGGFIVYDGDKKRMNKKPFTTKSKANNYITDLESGNADESKYHATKSKTGSWKHIFVEPNKVGKSWKDQLKKSVEDQYNKLSPTQQKEVDNLMTFRNKTKEDAVRIIQRKYGLLSGSRPTGSWQELPTGRRKT
jgi:glycosidase